MKITVAGTKKDFEEGLTISKLIELENVETPEYVTVSVNEEFAQRDDFDTTVLKDGDEVEFLYFMGGGCK
ncbi:MAG: sulfur carrier protein ThiS [Butyrivibrio sp.]|jgi:sulfur carrier protein|nr:sulfur carrier protein ThiS [Butyrivibrio sp.]